MGGEKSQGIKTSAVNQKYALPLLALSILAPISVFGSRFRLPSSGLDPSWVVSTAEAVERRLRFGVEFMFTYGPYGSLITNMPAPSFIYLHLLGVVVVSFAMFLIALRLMRNNRLAVGYSFTILVALLGQTNQEVALASIATFMVVLCLDSHPMKNIELVVLFSLLALLALVKGSLATLSIALLLLVIIRLFINSGNILTPLAYVGVFAADCAILWMASLQSLWDLPSFIRGSFELTLGYSEAMSKPGPMGELIQILITMSILGVVLLVSLIIQREKLVPVLLMSSGVIVLMGLIWKISLVRHDGHVATFVIGLFLLMPMVVYITKLGWQKNIAILTLPAIFAIGISGARGINLSLFDALNRFQISLTSQATYLTNPQATILNFKAQYSEGKMSLASTVPSNFCQGAQDVYPWEQSLLVGAENWSPRPVIQSYASYTTYLSNLNESHLKSTAFGTRIMARLYSIDSRLPLMADAASWAHIRESFSLVDSEEGWLCLEKTQVESDPITSSDTERTITATLGQRTEPPFNEPLQIRLKIQKTFLGHAYSALFKPPPVQMSVEYKDGRTSTFRVIPRMASQAFIPLGVETSADFEALFVDSDALSTPVSLTVQSSNPLNLVLWASEFEISFLPLEY